MIVICLAQIFIVLYVYTFHTFFQSHLILFYSFIFLFYLSIFLDFLSLIFLQSLQVFKVIYYIDNDNYIYDFMEIIIRKKGMEVLIFRREEIFLRA